MAIHFKLEEFNQRKYPLPPEVEGNINQLIEKLSVIRETFGYPMIITSGYRSVEDQKRIYAGKAKIPMGSLHLIGAAADVADRDGCLAAFVHSNIPMLEELGLWIEDTTRTRGWVHLQLRPPVSGNRFFTP